MRILIVNKRAPFEGRGAEQVIWKIAKRFASEGHEVLFFTGSPQDPGTMPNIDGIQFEFVETADAPSRGMVEFFLKGPLLYPRVYRTFVPDLIYDNPSPFPFHYAHLYGDALVVNKVHAIYRQLAFSCKDHPLVKLGTIFGEETYRLARGEYFITNSESTAERLSSLVDTDRNEIFVNPVGIDLSEFEFSMNQDSKTVLSLSKLNSRKDIGTLLEAWGQVEKENRSSELIIAGSGPLESELRNKAGEMDLSRVSFEGFVNEERKHELLRASLIYVLPTLYEGFGLSNLEAMASGSVVVSTDTWGVRDYLADGENGRLVPPEDPRALSDAITDLLEHPECTAELARAGRETAENYEMDKSLDREVEILEDWV